MFKKITTFVTPLLLSLPVFAKELKLGDPVPSVKATQDDSKIVNLGKLAEEGYTLVYFYPKADTPGCTAQACSIRDHFDVLTQKGVQVFGVSTDDVEAQSAFKKKHRLPFSLIADTKKEVTRAFGVPTTMGFASRQAFLFHHGKLIWMDKSASTKEQADDVLKVLEERS